MSGSLTTRVFRSWKSTHRFFSDDVWKERLSDLPPGRAFRYRSARILYATLRGLFVEETLHVRAAALTYFTVLSMVPLLAFAFAMLKGFGAYDLLVERSIRPTLDDLFAGNQALGQALERTLGFVERTNVASLGLVGLLFLLYAATRLLRNIEGALNEIFGAGSARDFFRQLRDYTAIIVVTPLCLMAAFALTTLGQAVALIRTAGDTLGLGRLTDQLLAFIGPIAVLFLGLLFLYTVLPNASVKLRSAVTGALIGAVLWYVVLLAHVHFQIGVARYNALYSSFAALPIFLAWQYVSWLVVLVGAQITAVHQRHPSLASRARAPEPALREILCLSAVFEVARSFLQGTSPPTKTELSSKLNTSEELIKEWLAPLIQRGLLLEFGGPDRVTYALGMTPDRIRGKDLLDSLRRLSASPTEWDAVDGIDPLAKKLWLDLDRGALDSSANRSLRDLVEEPEAAELPRGDSPES